MSELPPEGWAAKTLAKYMGRPNPLNRQLLLKREDQHCIETAMGYHAIMPTQVARQGENLQVRRLKREERAFTALAMGKLIAKRKTGPMRTSAPNRPSKLSKMTLVGVPSTKVAENEAKEGGKQVENTPLGVYDECISAAAAPKPPMPSIPVVHRRILQLQKDDQEFVQKESSCSRVQKKPTKLPTKINKKSASGEISTVPSKQHKKPVKHDKENSNPKTPRKPSKTPKKFSAKKFSKTPTAKKFGSNVKAPNMWQLSASKRAPVGKNLRNISASMPALPIYIDQA